MVDGLFFGHFFWKVEGSCVHTRESRVAHVHGNAFTCSISSMVEGSPLTYSSHVAHLHGNTLMCSISSMVEGSPSRTAHMWLTCTVMPSRVAFPQWWRGAPHVQLTCGSCAW